MADSSDFGLVMPFFIDTDGYSDRDRLMFVCGVEFQMVYEAAKAGRGWNQAIHTENESRVRMMCGKLGLPCKVTRHCDTWSELEIPKREVSE